MLRISKFWTLALLIALASCETEEGFPRTEMRQTDLPGAFFYSEVGPSLRFLYGVNRTPDWVTFFVYTASSGGNLDLDYIVSQGMGVKATVLSAYETGSIAYSFPREDHYWVWARSGRLQIQNREIVPW
jgi:hypothetical protein